MFTLLSFIGISDYGHFGFVKVLALLWSQVPLQQVPPLMTSANVCTTAHLNELICMGLMALRELYKEFYFPVLI